MELHFHFDPFEKNPFERKYLGRGESLDATIFISDDSFVCYTLDGCME
jgi:hypothetical protein